MPPARTSQQHLLDEILPLLRASGAQYRKVRGIQARRARLGEVVITRTSDGVETEQTAHDDHVYVQALTAAGERYLLARRVFDARYENAQAIGEQMTHFNPLGRILALLVNDNLIQLLGQGEAFVIEAPWGSDMTVRAGDMFASPLPELNEVYRIAAREFAETYAPIAPPAAD